jgi:polyribonucleotide nucleotidyltransferase
MTISAVAAGSRGGCVPQREEDGGASEDDEEDDADGEVDFEVCGAAETG